MQTQKQSKAGTRRKQTPKATEEIPVAALDAAFIPETPAVEAVAVEAPVKAVKVLPTPAEALATAREKNPERFAHVIRVTEQTVKGEPKRVVISCTKPETKMVNGEAVSVCEGIREIAIQDLFQVRQCAACADRSVRKARRNRAKAKDKAIRQQIKAMRAGR